MNSTEQFAELMSCNSVVEWRNLIFSLGNELGYEQTLLAIFPDRHTPIEAEFAFLHSNYSFDWRKRYDEQKFGYVDPTVSHCANKLTPLIWSPNIFSARRQREMYEEACGHGLRSGITLPIHGAHGELGILSFVSDMKPSKRFQQEAHSRFPKLSYFRDFIFETSLRFMKPPELPEKPPHVTPSELECLKWCVAGKCSWDIAKILHCSEPTINFHFKNLRRKFCVSSRQQVMIKAMRFGLIRP